MIRKNTHTQTSLVLARILSASIPSWSLVRVAFARTVSSSGRTFTEMSWINLIGDGGKGIRDGVLAACTRLALLASTDSVGEPTRLPPLRIVGARAGVSSEASSDSSLKHEDCSVVSLRLRTRYFTYAWARITLPRRFADILLGYNARIMGLGASHYRDVMSYGISPLNLGLSVRVSSFSSRCL